MKQSLQASKTGQWLKQGQARLEQERVLQVLRSSSLTPRPAAPIENDYASSSSSDSARGRGHAPSIPPSASSLEQVALASPSPALQRAFDDAYRDRDAALPPPTHPARKSAPPSASSRASASSGSSSHLPPSPERDREHKRERPAKPPPPPKPRSLTGAPAESPFASPPLQTRLKRSNSLRHSPPPPMPRARARPESVHALLGGIAALRLTDGLGSLRAAAAGAAAESPFGDPVSPRARGEEREALVARRAESESEDSSSDSDVGTDADADGGWVGVGRFGESEADLEEPKRGERRRSAVSRERDSLKWPVDVEGEGWRPL